MRAAFAPSLFDRCRPRGATASRVFERACEGNCLAGKVFRLRKGGQGHGELWGSETDARGPELKEQDAGNLRSRALAGGLFEFFDGLGNQLNYAANEPPRVPLPRRGPGPSVRPCVGPLSQQRPLIMAPNGIPSAVYFFFSVFSARRLVFFCVSLFPF